MARIGRLRRSDCSGAGLRRIRRGRGFSYLDENGDPIRDPVVLERLSSLAIPPAWQHVWICPDPVGHLQATGIDAAGRKQYVYHDRWRAHRDRQKFERMMRFAETLPRLRREIASELDGSPAPSREAVLSLAARLLDVGLFRIGGEQYADEDGGIGLATIRKEHVTIRDGSVAFDYPAKSGVRRIQEIYDPMVVDLLKTLRRRRGGADELMAYREGRHWRHLRSEDINEYLKRHLGEEFSAKDFRTWNGTVLAAVSLAASTSGGPTGKRAINRAVRDVAELLGNTPAVARRAYIDPRVIDLYQSGSTVAPALRRIGSSDLADDRIRGRIERAVLGLLNNRN